MHCIHRVFPVSAFLLPHLTHISAAFNLSFRSCWYCLSYSGFFRWRLSAYFLAEHSGQNVSVPYILLLPHSTQNPIFFKAALFSAVCCLCFSLQILQVVFPSSAGAVLQYTHIPLSLRSWYRSLYVTIFQRFPGLCAHTLSSYFSNLRRAYNCILCQQSQSGVLLPFRLSLTLFPRQNPTVHPWSFPWKLSLADF